MAVHITDETALKQIGKLEGQAWVDLQWEDWDATDGCSFYHARYMWKTHNDNNVEIYGSGGLARYTLSEQGCIVLIGGSAGEEKEDRARALGFAVSAYDRGAIRAVEKARDAYKDERREDMFNLCRAILYDVGAALKYSPEQLTSEQVVGTDARQLMFAQMAGRINGWANHRLGIVDPETMSDLALRCNETARLDHFARITGDLPKIP